MQTALITWLSQFVHDLFGENPYFKIDRIAFSGKDSARSQVMIGASSSSQFWIFDWVYEWGDWRIDSYECMRGCA